MTIKNVDKIINNIIPKNKTIIYYYSDKCPYCIMIKGLWRDITKKYKNSKTITLISINRDIKEIFDKLPEDKQVDIVPTFIYYKNGKSKQEFTKKREYDDLIKFIEKYNN